MRRILFVLILLVPPAVLGAEERPFPAGKSTASLGGLSWHVEMPMKWDPAREYSLLVCLHGAGATGESLASWFGPLVGDDFILLAPQAKGPAWNKPDVEIVRGVVKDLLPKLRIGAGRLHATGFSNGGMHLPFLVFEDAPAFATVCFMGSGFGGGRVPARARKEMAALALVGAEDRFFGAAKETPKRLEGKVRRADFLAQKDLAHEIPDQLIPYYYSWLRAMEGRFHPGEDGSFPWIDDLSVAKETLAESKGPSFFYIFDEKDEHDADAKHLQNEVFLDPAVQEAGRRLTAVKIDRELEEEFFTSLGLTKTPAVVVMKPGPEPLAKFEGKIDAKPLAAALRTVTPD
jgi:predicted esterase